MLGENDIKPSGARCVGIKFDVPFKSGIPIDNVKVSGLEHPVSGTYSTRPASWRRCGWDGHVVPPQANGEVCVCCKRVVDDPPQLTFTEYVFAPAFAMQVYLPQIRGWVLVEVPFNDVR